MTLEEAISKYGIPIPKDTSNYDKEEFREFDEMYIKCLYVTFSNDNRVKNRRVGTKTAVVLGGQTGAGKSSIVADTKRKFNNEGRRIVLIDDDQYRKLYPYGKNILEECPEHYTKITATATSVITPKILKFATDNEYNFIFDGTMKNPRIIETMRTWNGYTIQAKIMATSQLRSLMSTAIRNGEMRIKGEEGRFITQDVHDETYYGIPYTLDYLEKTGLADVIEIYTRSKNPFFPTLQFSSATHPEVSASQELIRLRGMDEKSYLDVAEQDIKYLNSLSQNLSYVEQKENGEIIKKVEGKISQNLSNDYR